MKKTVLSFLLFMSVILILAACGNNKIDPVAINEKTDKCATCNMQVLDDQFATEIILENGKSLVFDDIGCMYKWVKDNADKKVAEEFVRDYNTQAWVRKKDATYVYDLSTQTPMSYNIISFKNKADAEKFVASHKGSTLMTSTELDKHDWKVNKEMMMQKGDTSYHTHSEDGTKEMVGSTN